MVYSYKTVQALRDELLTQLLWISAILGTAPILLGLNTPGVNMAAPTLLYLLIILTAFARNASYTLRASILIFVPYLVSLDSLLTYGIFSASRMLATLFVILAGLLFGVRSGVVALTVYLVTVAISSWLIVQGKIVVHPDAQTVSSLPINWVAYILTFIFATCIIYYSIMFLIQSLTQQFKNLRIEGEEKDAARQAERETEANYRLLAENIHDVIWTRTMDGQLTYISPSVKQMRGFTSEELMSGESAFGGADENTQIFAELMREELTLEASGTADPNRSRAIELKATHVDGSVLNIEVVMSFLRDTDQKAIGILGVTRDITERKKLEYQLQQAQKMEAVGTLAGGIAHDFNNILHALLGFCEAARVSVYEDKTRLTECLDGIESSGKRAASLVKQLLTFSRAEETDREVVDLVPIIKESLKLLQSTLPSTIEFQIDLANNPNPVLADSTQIHQIILNLGINAAQAMEETGGTLRITMKNVSLDEPVITTTSTLDVGRYVLLAVEDTGCGIEPDHQDRVFEPFFTTKKQGEGTGIGLATTHGIVSSMGGAIKLESKIGVGTVFKVYFPQSLEQSVEQDESDHQQSPDPHGVGHILFVDDEASIAKVATMLLIGRGFTVETFVDSKEALEAFESNPEAFSVVVTDLTMPNLTGFDLAKRIRSIDPTIPILMTSGRIETNSEEHTDVTEMLRKPIDINDLVDAINRCTAQRHRK